MSDMPSIVPAARQVGTVERAFELARSGDCRTVDDIRERLKRERHDAVEAHLAGNSIKGDLRRVCAEAGAGRREDQPENGAS